MRSFGRVSIPTTQWGRITATAVAASLAALVAGPLAAPAYASTTGGPDLGQVVVWGSNNYHLSDQAPAGAIAVSAKENMGVALTWQHRVAAWGDDSLGQTNVPSGLSDAIAVAAGGTFAMALRSNGAVVAWGDNTYGQRNVPAAAQSGVVAISAGPRNGYAIKTDGSVVAWGDNTYGQRNVPAGLKLKAISAFYHVLGIKADGTVVSWGWNQYGQANVPAGLANVTQVSAGYGFSMALLANGHLALWGDNSQGQLMVPCVRLVLTGQCVVQPSGFTDISAGMFHAAALTTGGFLEGWGYDGNGQIDFAASGFGSDGDFVHVAAGSNFTAAVHGAPTTPTAGILELDAGNGRVLVWIEPESDGGVPPVTLFSVTASPGGATCSVGADGPYSKACIVSGLTNGQPYTFTVRATNAMGAGLASPAAGPVTPAANKSF